MPYSRKRRQWHLEKWFKAYGDTLIKFSLIFFFIWPHTHTHTIYCEFCMLLLLLMACTCNSLWRTSLGSWSHFAHMHREPQIAYNFKIVSHKIPEPLSDRCIDMKTHIPELPCRILLGLELDWCHTLIRLFFLSCFPMFSLIYGPGSNLINIHLHTNPHLRVYFSEIDLRDR